jgi:hypothetical protein
MNCSFLHDLAYLWRRRKEKMGIRKVGIFMPRTISKRAVPALVVMAFSISLSLNAQTASDSPEHRWNFNVGGGVTPTVGDISSRLNTGGHFTVGGGYNFTNSLGVALEYMYTGFGVDRSVLRALDVPDGDAHMHSVTLNPIWHFKTVGRFGGYAIGGGGFYRRTVEFTQPTTAIVTVFDPWWGYLGPAIVSANQVLGSVTSNAGGINAGLGITIDLGHGGTKFYGEIRYHYAATHRARNTQILPVTFGIRW